MRFKSRFYLFLFGVVLLLSNCKNDPRTPNTASPSDPTGWFNSSNLSKGIFFAAAADPSNTDVIYAGSSTISVYRTDNGGALWNSARLGLPLAPIRSLFVDPATPTNVYAGMPGGGVYMTADSGGTWQPLNTGLSNTDVYAVVYNPYAAPTGFEVTSSDTVNVLHWNAVPNATLYEIFVCTSNCRSTTPAAGLGNWGLITRTGDEIAKRDYRDTGLTNGTAYYYLVRAVVSGVHSPYSSKISSVPKPNAGANPIVFYPNEVGVTAGNNQNTLQWSGVSGATYNVYRKDQPGVSTADTRLTSTPISTLSFVDTTAINDQPAYYIVTALLTTNTGTTEGASAEVSAAPHAMTALFAGTGGGGVFASGPAGEFRSAVNGGDLSLADAQDISSLLVDPATLTNDLPTLYAGTHGGVYRTPDGGKTWSLIPGTLPPVLSLVQSGPTLFAGTASGIYQGAADGSSPWKFLSHANEAMTSIAVDPSDPATLYVTSATAGLFKSSDGGATWAASNSGLTVLDIRSILVHPKNRNLLYAGGVGSFFKSTNGGGQWTPIDLGTLENVSNPLSDSNIQTLAATPGVGSLLYAGGDAGIFKSADQGRGWAAMNSQLGAKMVMALQVDPTRPAVLYAAVADLGIYKSLDGGGSWRLENGPTGSAVPQNVTALIIDPADPTRFYAGTSGLGIYRGTEGTDGHLSWARAKISTDASLDSGGILSLAATAGSATTVYAGTFQNGIFRLVDDGASAWEKLGGGLSDKSILALAVHPQRAATLYAGTSAGLYVSEDGGANWLAVGGLGNVEVHAVSFDSAANPARPLIYVGTTSGVFKSLNDGASWVHMNDGMAASVSSVLIDPQQPSIVYAGTLSSGLFKRTQ